MNVKKLARLIRRGVIQRGVVRKMEYCEGYLYMNSPQKWQARQDYNMDKGYGCN